MATLTYPKILQMAKQLPPETQLALADTLVHAYAGNRVTVSEGQALTPIVGLSSGELQALAHAVVAADRQDQLQSLLEKNRQGTLSADEEQTLDTLLAEADQVALLKARALYTIQIFSLITVSQS